MSILLQSPKPQPLNPIDSRQRAFAARCADGRVVAWGNVHSMKLARPRKSSRFRGLGFGVQGFRVRADLGGLRQTVFGAGQTVPTS